MERRQPETKTAGGRFGLSKPHKDLLPLPDGATGRNAKDEQMLSASAAEAAASRAGGFRAPDGSSSSSSRGVGGVLEDDKKRRMSPSFTSPPPSSSLYSTSPSSSAAVRRDGAAAAVAGGPINNTGAASASQPCCQAEKCMANLTEAKRYHRRHKVCEAHSKAPVVLVAGLRQRFCQQCSRFHELSEFDDTKRSCRRRLAGHNERRRKSSADSQEEGSSTNRCRQTDHNRKIQITMPGTAAPTPAAYKHFQIR